ncbi:LuxR family transcriptional regulator [Streptomyces sp. HSG2]|uniref:helix-turn-helix transcriptional regulator n=1 Tax=Streptomyces sp. HSG2 TaxID=2797167 RepID=UPI001F5C0401|nr:LuxR family transcriptional regulator [Streptomyces sp. HSG2]
MSGRLGPPLLGPLLDRPRLSRRLDAGVRGRFTVVVGSPGAGKTALLASWARTRTRTAWLTLDADDHDVARLLAHLEAALERVGVRTPGFGSSHGRLPSPDVEWDDPAPPGEADVTPPPAVLVLDGIHELGAGPALNALLQFTRYAPAHLHVVLASRREPDLPLHKLRALGELTEIRGSDLAFTREEAAELFRAHGAEAGEERMTKVIECSGGWALAVRYAAVHPVRHTSHQSCLEGWSQAVRSCSDFLIAELLEPLPAEHQDVLLRTSVLTEFSASLVRALTGREHAHRTLRILATEYDLMDRDDEWTYRLPNPLIRGVLSRELAERCGWDEVIRVLRTAARWHAEAGHHAKAEEYGRSADTHATRSDFEPGIVLPPALVEGLRSAGGAPAADPDLGGAAVSPVAVAAGVVPSPRPPLPPRGLEPLTPTELEVLRLLPGDLTLEEIAVRRHVSLNTVKTQVKAVYRKLRVGRRRDAVLAAVERGMI